MQYEQHPASPAQVSFMLRPAEWAAPAQPTPTAGEPLNRAPRYDDVSDVDVTSDESSSSQEDAMSPDSTLGSHDAGSPAPATAKTESTIIAAALADANNAYSVEWDTYAASPWAWEGSPEQDGYYLQGDQLPWRSPETFLPAYEGDVEPVAEYDPGHASSKVESRLYSDGGPACEHPDTPIVGHVPAALLPVLNGPDTPEREALLAILDHDGYRA
ncbi:hypothetical protein AURDEDRAFT_127134 [Auricularia subglabra TFB-10046 SS5]|uniref:Uncharacterized protein n=1 Tax=Auricularia subglabra (strain TFB-10046 / SS5) TaxID=717982 RepID=J0LKC1_AURST|nr:hypothetical protein AURDEDRAFT_127134 [Auricularia subglabra TFB-10046 SS5]